MCPLPSRVAPRLRRRGRRLPRRRRGRVARRGVGQHVERAPSWWCAPPPPRHAAPAPVHPRRGGARHPGLAATVRLLGPGPPSVHSLAAAAPLSCLPLSDALETARPAPLHAPTACAHFAPFDICRRWTGPCPPPLASPLRTGLPNRDSATRSWSCACRCDPSYSYVNCLGKGAV